MSAEPTDADWAVATFIAIDRISPWLEGGAVLRDSFDTRTAIAHLLASQRAEIVARYEAVAAELQADARERISEGEQGLADSGYALFMAGARIREAAPK